MEQRLALLSQCVTRSRVFDSSIRRNKACSLALDFVWRADGRAASSRKEVVPMQYYDIYRHYSVPAHRFNEARVKFSRALEDHDEDQYYVDTSYGFAPHERPKGILAKLLILIPWFLEEARNQIFGYPKQQQY
jgi:hypothetical protein